MLKLQQDVFNDFSFVEFELEIWKVKIINKENHSFKTTLNKSNPNLIIIDIDQEKKMIDISQIRELLSNLQKSSFNNKPKFILIDNIEFLNANSINALLKVLSEQNYFCEILNKMKYITTRISGPYGPFHSSSCGELARFARGILYYALNFFDFLIF